MRILEALKKNLGLLAFAAAMFAHSGSYATHIIGGELYYDYLGNDTYLVTLTLYRDCSMSVQFDSQGRISVFSGSGVYLTQYNIPIPPSSFVPVELDTPCLTLPPDLCIETVSYSTEIVLPPSEDGYHLSFQRCCRQGTIVNIQNPTGIGITCTIQVPPQGNEVNSSARFNDLPPIALCLNEPLVFDHSASEPDGDELVYSLTTPYAGGAPGSAYPNPAAPPPYNLIPWADGYSEEYQIDSDPMMAIDPVTGILTVKPTVIGNFVCGVSVKEYRDGVLLSETIRDFLFSVVPCDATVIAAIAPQPQGEICEGVLTQVIGNNSIGGQYFSWDFGDPNTDADTSNVANPTWTYDGPGTYTITLIVNPGAICADTAQVTYYLYPTPEPYFEVPEPTCGELQTTLTAEGMNLDNSMVAWYLGWASPSFATSTEVDVTFPPIGVQLVTLTITENGCTGTFEAEVHVFPDDAEAIIAPQTVFCMGEIPFASNSTVEGTYHWDFGDPSTEEDTSTFSNPTWTYPEPGEYTVTLILNPGSLCADTTQTIFMISPQPEPYFTAPQMACGGTEAVLTAVGMNTPDAEIIWDLGEGTPSSATGPQVTVTFPPAGDQSITLSISENGCIGTYSAYVNIIPGPTAYFIADPGSPQPVGTDVMFFNGSEDNGAPITQFEWIFNGQTLDEEYGSWTWEDAQPGTHVIILSLENDLGCSDTYTLYFVIEPEEIDIPNVFTPNNDGHNDAFVIENIEYYPNTLTIFNRWGIPIYEAENYRNQWRAQGIPEGTYYYVLNMGDGRSFTGHLTLLR